jgi:tRNA(adenine34) deaminase
MEMALHEAHLCGDDVPVGCVLVRDNILIAKGNNQKEKTQDPTDHAEIVVIRQACSMQKSWRLDGTTLYTTLEPCPICAETIMQSRVSRLVFGAYDPNSGAVGSKFNLFIAGRPYPIPQVTGGIMQEQCQSLLQVFFRQRRK